MEDLDRRVRKLVFDHFLENGTAPAMEEVAIQLRISVAEAGDAFVRLDEAHHLKLLEGTRRILMTFPFSAISTPFRVTRSNGRCYFANCAWDSIAFHVMLSEPIRIDSFCAHCGERVQFRLENGRGVPTLGALPLVHLRLPAAEWWKDITRTCANTMVFLSSAEHHAGAGGNLAEQGVITVGQVLEMSGPIYGGKLRFDYDRPSLETVRSTYERAGLTGPYWKL